MNVLDKFKLEYEDLPHPKSKLYTSSVRRVGTWRSSFIQRTRKRKDNSESTTRFRWFIR